MSSRAELVEAFIPHSPFVGHLGMRRGQSLCFCEVDATGEAGQVVAKGLVTHRFA